MSLRDALYLPACAVFVFTIGSAAGDLLRLTTPFDSMPLWLAGGWISLAFTCGFFFSTLRQFLIAYRKRNTRC